MEKQFFYDRFTEADIAGMFNLTHLLYGIAFFSVLALLLYFSRHMTETAVRRVHFWIAVGVTVMEVFKIAIRVYKEQSLDSWIPLYFCSLFLFAVWLPFTKVKWLSYAGYAYMTLGGVPAAILFTCYPSTSLALFPIWHPAVFHSGIFHLAMIYLGILLLWKQVYTPRLFHILPYFLFITAFVVPSLILNAKYGTNCLFLRHAYKLPVLEWMFAISPTFYTVCAFLAQSVLVYLVPCGIWTLLTKPREENKREIKENKRKTKEA